MSKFPNAAVGILNGATTTRLFEVTLDCARKWGRL